MIPRIIHQTWMDGNVPERFRASPASWKEHHPAWEYRLWTDEDLRAFVEREFPEVVPLYRSYPDDIQRIDAARYLILHRLGGLYSDLDIVCLHPFDAFLECEAVLPRTRPYGHSNDLMMAAPGSRLFARAVAGLPAAYARWQHGWVPRHFRVLLTTGSLYITQVARADDSGLHELSPARYDSDGDEAWVRHLPGNTWAGWDTHVFLFVHRHRALILAAVVLLLSLVLIGAP